MINYSSYFKYTHLYTIILIYLLIKGKTKTYFNYYRFIFYLFVLFTFNVYIMCFNISNDIIKKIHYFSYYHLL